MDLRVAKFAKIDLGLVNPDGSVNTNENAAPLVLYLSLVSFDVNHDGQLYLSNGVLLDISRIIETLKLEKTSTVITFSALNPELTRAFNSRVYRNRPCTIYVAQIMDDGTLINIRSTTMYGDSHKYRKSTISYVVHSIWSRFEQNRGSKTSGSQQAALISTNAFEGVPSDSVDLAFDNAAQDFTGIVLGQQAAGVSVTKVRGGFLGLKKEKIKTPIPGSPGTSLADDGTDYIKEIPYGATQCAGNLIAAWSPSLDQVVSRFGALDEWVNPPDRVVRTTRFICLIYAVCEGRVGDLTVVVEDQNLGVAGQGWRNIPNSETGSLYDYKYTFEFDDSDGHQTAYMTSSRDRNRKIAFVAGADGRDNQLALDDFVHLGEGINRIWTEDHKGYGTVLVGILLQASTLWDGGVPGIYFETKGRIVKGAGGYSGVTESPHHVIYDFLTDIRFGPGISSDKIDEQSFIDAGPLYDRNFAGQNYSAFIRGTLTGTGSYRESIQSILEACQSNLIINREGKIELLVKGYISDSNLQGLVQTIDLSRSDREEFGSFTYRASSEVYNQVNLTVPIVNRKPGQNYDVTVIDEKALEYDNFQKSALDITANMLGACLRSDGEPLFWTREMTLEFANAELCRSRIFTICKFNTFAWNYPDMKCGDIIGISDPLYLPPANNVVPFRITKIGLIGTSTLEIMCVEYSNRVYDINASVAFRPVFTRIGGDFGSGFSISAPSSPQNLIAIFEEDLSLLGRFSLNWTPPLRLGTEDLVDNFPVIYNIYGGLPARDSLDIDSDGNPEEIIASAEEFLGSVTSSRSLISYRVTGRGRGGQNYYHITATNSLGYTGVPSVINGYADEKPIDLNLPGSFPVIDDTHRFELIISQTTSEYKVLDELLLTVTPEGVEIINGAEPILVKLIVDDDVTVGGKDQGAINWGGFPDSSIFDILLRKNSLIIGMAGQSDRPDTDNGTMGVAGMDGGSAIHIDGITFTSIRGVEGETGGVILAGGGGEGGAGGGGRNRTSGHGGNGAGWDSVNNILREVGQDGLRPDHRQIAVGGSPGIGGAGGYAGSGSHSSPGVRNAGGGGGGGFGSGGGSGGGGGAGHGDHGQHGLMGLSAEAGGFGGLSVRGGPTGGYDSGDGGDGGRVFQLSSGALQPIIGLGILVLDSDYQQGTIPNIAVAPRPITNPYQTSDVVKAKANVENEENEVGEVENALSLSFSSNQITILSTTSPTGFRVGHVVLITGPKYSYQLSPDETLFVNLTAPISFAVISVDVNVIVVQGGLWQNASTSPDIGSEVGEIIILRRS